MTPQERNLKSGKVRAGGIYHPITGEELPVHFDRASHLFSAFYASEHFTGPTYVEVENALDAFVQQETPELEWSPVIIATIPSRFRVRYFEGRVRRAYCAALHMANEKTTVYLSPWSDGPNPKLRMARGKEMPNFQGLPHTRVAFYGELVLYLPYAESLYQALVDLRAHLARAQVAAANWLTSAEGRERLMRVQEEGWNIGEELASPDSDYPAGYDAVAELVEGIEGELP
jgi:hypothetical protein